MNMKLVMKILIGLAILIILVTGGLFIWARFFKSPTTPQGVTSVPDVETLATKLAVPWEVVFLPGGDLLVSERPGIIKRIGKDSNSIQVEGVEHVGEGGLLGMALHPNFAKNQYIYLYLTTKDGGGITNRVERYKLNGNQLSDKTIILANIPGSANHDGGRIAFGPDSKLYITTGDAGQPNLAQGTNSLAGKILRINDDGTFPADNPFRNAVYSYGHRNPQGIAWDDKGQLWETEHGRSGLESGLDEINLIKPGGNYGWPVIEGDETAEGMITPVLNSGPTETWAPASLAFSNGSLFFGGLRGESLYQAKISSDNKLSLQAHFRGEYGRLRDVVIGPEGFLYVSTSNTDGRGQPDFEDDKLLKIKRSIFAN